MLGIPQELFTPIFAIARMPGWSAHRLEELTNANKIIRPAYKYVGHHTEFETMEERSAEKITDEDVEEEPEEENSAQFDVSDRRTLDEVVCWLMEMGFVPSFCTACYREGRTGDRFMKLLKSRQIVNCCHPNALMTLKEYLEDYASPKTKEIGEALIQKELNVITNPKVKEKAAEYIANIHNGQRDFRF